MKPATTLSVDVSVAKSMPSEELLFRDGLGDRLLVRDAHGQPAQESLLLRPELTSIPSFEFALNERLWLVERFDHPAFLIVRNIVSVPGQLPLISLVSDYAGGIRLSEVLARAESTHQKLTQGAAVFVIKEILDALAELHRHNGDLSHGCLGPERVVLADGKVRLADYVLGPALEQLRFSPDRYWKELRVPVPSSAGAVRLDRRIDIAQVGMIAVALFASRELRQSESIGGLSEVLAEVTLAPSIRTWLMKALHMDPRSVFVTAADAVESFTEAMHAARLVPAPGDLNLEGAQSRADSPKTARITPIALKMAPPPPVQRAAPAATVKPVPTFKAGAVKSVPAPARTRDVWDAHDVDLREPAARVTTRHRPSMPVGPNFTKFLRIAFLAILLTAAFTAAQYIPAPEWLFSTTGTLVIESNPQGVPVFVNGTEQGATPLTLKVERGTHEVELRGPGKPKVFRVFVARGDRVAQYVEFPPERRR